MVVTKNKNLSVKEYLYKIKPYLGDIIINHLTIAINFTSSKDIEHESLMHTKSENKEFILYDNANELVDKFFK